MLMSEYQYYEFCKLNKPLSKECRDEMKALSKRAKVGTHNAQYTYSYGDFRGDELELLVKYFDVFFYISNFGDLQLTFRYDYDEINEDKIKPYLLDNVVESKKIGNSLIIKLIVNSQNGGFSSWLENTISGFVAFTC